MFGLDDWIAGLSTGHRSASSCSSQSSWDFATRPIPDHIAAMTTLVASGRERQRDPRLGSALGGGRSRESRSSSSGCPILLAERYLPERVQQGAETAVAALIVFLAVRLLVRWRHGVLRPPRSYAFRARASSSGTHAPGAFGVGLVHGMGGSAGVGVLLLAAIPSETVAVVFPAPARAVHRCLDDDRDDRLWC